MIKLKSVLVLVQLFTIQQRTNVLIFAQHNLHLEHFLLTSQVATILVLYHQVALQIHMQTLIAVPVFPSAHQVLTKMVSIVYIFVLIIISWIKLPKVALKLQTVHLGYLQIIKLGRVFLNVLELMEIQH